MILIYSLIILLFPFIISVNVLIYRAMVKKAIRKYIEPKLKEKGLLFINYKWPGLLSTGDFDNGWNITLNTGGNTSQSVYVYIYYEDSSGAKRITARIDTTLWFINSVTYSSEL